MEYKKIYRKYAGKILCLCAALSLLIAGCSPFVKENHPVYVQDNSFSEENFPVTVENINSKGEPVEEIFTAPPERVVAVWQNSIETILALGAGDRIVAGMGIPDRKYLLPQYRETYDRIPYTSLENLDMETIMMMQPDLIVGWYSTFSAKTLRSTDFWQERGIHTYISPASFHGTTHKTVEMEYQDILNMGKIFGREDKAYEIVNRMKDEINSVTEKSKAAGLHRKGLIIELQGKGISVYGSRTLAGDILNHVGGELLAPTETQISAEELLELEPDAIFVVTIESDYGHEEQILNRLYNNEALRTLRCIQDRRIYTLPLYAVYSSGVRTYDGIQMIAQGLYPELYK